MNGVINVFKEKGVTSFQVVSSIRKIFDIKKVGHLGTLDPLAEGVLPICIGYATKFADYLSATKKEYIAEFTFGLKTDSYDITGAILETNNNIIPTTEQISIELAKFIGTVELIVPSFSAKKIDGVRAYKLARAGKIENAGSAYMIINNIDLLDYAYPTAVIKVVCEKGTYIRSIIDTLGNRLKCFATMTKLLRSENGIFKSKDAFTLSMLEELKQNNNLSTAVISVTDILTDWGRVAIKQSEVEKIMNGMSLPIDAYINLDTKVMKDNYFIFNHDTLIATATKSKDNFIPLKINAVFK